MSGIRICVRENDVMNVGLLKAQSDRVSSRECDDISQSCVVDVRKLPHRAHKAQALDLER